MNCQSLLIQISLWAGPLNGQWKVRTDLKDLLGHSLIALKKIIQQGRAILTDREGQSPPEIPNPRSDLKMNTKIINSLFNSKIKFHLGPTTTSGFLLMT
jgi:hypothetical protein